MNFLKANKMKNTERKQKKKYSTVAESTEELTSFVNSLTLFSSMGINFIADAIDIKFCCMHE